MAEGFLSAEIVGDRNVLRNLDLMPETVKEILAVKVQSYAEELRDLVESNIRSRLNKTDKEKKYSGSPRHMADSVEVEMVNDGVKINGYVYIQGIPYAQAQEEGKAIPPHMIRPKDAKVLAFMAATGDKVFATRVFHPGGVIPASHFMKDAYRQMGPRISRGIKSAVVQGIRQQMRNGQ